MPVGSPESIRALCGTKLAYVTLRNDVVFGDLWYGYWELTSGVLLKVTLICTVLYGKELVT